MYKTVCMDCFNIWIDENDFCPECGSEKLTEFHLIECSCVECEQGFVDIEKIIMENK